jgi:hypothetical protein
MITNSPDKKILSKALLIILMFLVADLVKSELIGTWSEDLDESNGPVYVTQTLSPTKDNGLTSAVANKNNGLAPAVNLGVNGNEESRIIMEFDFSLTSGDSIQSATLGLSCSSNGNTVGAIHGYAARLNPYWEEYYSNWGDADNSTNWAAGGADGTADRGDWELPVFFSGSGVIEFNVTRLAQDAAGENASEIGFVITATNTESTCSTREAAGINRPSLTIEYVATAPGNSGTMVPDFIADGRPLMDTNQILAADVTPLVTWDSHTGSNIEVHFSNSSNWLDSGDGIWHWNSISNQSSFNLAGITGSFQVPLSNPLLDGRTMFYRMRSIGSTGAVGDWTEGYFDLPNHDITDNGDGSATFFVNIDNLGLDDNSLEDTFVNQTNSGKNSNYDLNYLTAGTSGNKAQNSYVRLRMSDLGMHSDSAVTDAKLIVSIFDLSGNVDLSIHPIFDDGLWTEDGATWMKSDGASSWDNGGRNLAQPAEDLYTTLVGTSEYQFNISRAVQHWIDTDDGSSDTLEFMITASGANEDIQSSSFVNFYSSEKIGSDALNISITYLQGSGIVPPLVIQSSPADGTGVWNISGHNLSGNTTPNLTWDQGNLGANTGILQIATDAEFRNLILNENSYDSAIFLLLDGMISLTGANTLALGNVYHWRIGMEDTLGQQGWWNSSSFVVSQLESTYLGNDRYEMRLRDGNATIDSTMPLCQDTFIDSGSSNVNYNGDGILQTSYSSGSETTILIGCDLRSHLLPDGYAIESATLSVKISDFYSGNPLLGIWENSRRNWSEDTATWNTYDGVNSWGSPGGKGIERGGLTSSYQFQGSEPFGSWVALNITQAVQNSMRDSTSVDLFLGIVGVGSGSSRDAYFAPNSETTVANRPQISFVYVEGSDEAPQKPTPISPLNGSWAVKDGIEVAPDTTPVLNWSFASALDLAGWTIEIDTAETFDTANLQSYTSWNDAGFDTTNLTYTPQTELNTGTTWYWRVLGVSSTFQIGQWSNVNNFLLPDLETSLLTATSSSLKIEHEMAMPTLNLPQFEDTWIASSGSDANITHASSTQMNIGPLGQSTTGIGLLRIPLSALPSPNNAHVSGAKLSMWALGGSSNMQMVGVHKTLVPWTDSANSSAYNSTDNWSTIGGDSDADRDYFVDIQAGVSNGWVVFNITELVQDALQSGQTHVSMMFTGDAGAGPVSFSTEDGNANERPFLNLTWEEGSAATSPDAANLVAPTLDEIMWDDSGHALLADLDPIFSWSHPSPGSVDAWRVLIWNDPGNDRDGWMIYDSRIDAGFDVGALTFSVAGGISAGQEVKWVVQPISDDILGNHSNVSSFHIPSLTGGELNSTDAWFEMQEGTIVTGLNYPVIFKDTTINSITPTTVNGSNELLQIGSNGGSASLIGVDFSSLPIPVGFEIVSAEIELLRMGGGSATLGEEELSISISESIVDWNESATWESTGVSGNWFEPGASGTSDSNIPIGTVNVTYTDNWFSFDVTEIVQRAHHNGGDQVELILRDDGSSPVDWFFASSEYSLYENRRPILNITYRTGVSWLPSSPSAFMPGQDSTLWNMSASIPTGIENVVINWTSSESNVTDWILEVSTDQSFMKNTATYNLSDSSSYNGTWDESSLTYTAPKNVIWGDAWYYIRVRAMQDHRFGEWSPVNNFRVPTLQGTDDGAGNNTMTLFRGSVFSQSGYLPSVPDATLDSTSATNALGTSLDLDLGISPSGSGEAQILLEFDLNEFPLPAATTPTNVLIRLNRTMITGTSALTVSAHACASFTEATVTWNSSPVCSSSEITRSTLGLGAVPSIVEWDITGLAQSNIANGNKTLTVLLKSVGTPMSSHKFSSSENANSDTRPQLVFEYVDNVDGIVPPSQASLISPVDGIVLYDTSSWVLQPEVSPVLEWNAVPYATSYILYLSNESSINKIQSIMNNNYTLMNDLEIGSLYEWWVQAVNGTITGPSSARWTFAVGAPVQNTDNGDHTWTYQYQTGNEVSSIGHTNVRDSFLDENNPDVNHGSDVLELGGNCGSVASECRIVIAVDAGQVPLPATAKIHSAAVRFIIYEEDFSAVNSMSISVHPLLTSDWAQSASTWNESSTGNAWSTAGMQAGVDYATDAISTTTVVPGQSEIWLDLGYSMMTINGDYSWIIIADNGNASANVKLVHSEDDDIMAKPLFVLNYTDIDHVVISPDSSAIVSADDTLQYSHELFDLSNNSVSGDVTWMSSSGSIDASGLFTPAQMGNHQVTACFGVNCETVDIEVTYGTPTTLDVTASATTISADQTMNISAVVYDQFSNIVPGQTITLTPSNGNVVGNEFFPQTVGEHTISVNWMSQTIDVPITVIAGQAVSLDLTGCDTDIPAGTTCTLVWKLYDQFQNEIQISLAGGLTWTIGNGTFDNTTGFYMGHAVGDYTIQLDSEIGLSDTVSISVLYGSIAELVVDVSSTIVSADDVVNLTTTRVDVMGNELAVTLLQENWSVNDGVLTAGEIAVWNPVNRSSNTTITASYEGLQTNVKIIVTQGALQDLELLVENSVVTGMELSMTTDDELMVRVRAYDADGNVWFENIDWNLGHQLYNDQAAIIGANNSNTLVFVPTKASPTEYTITGYYTNGVDYKEANITVIVSGGDLSRIEVQSPSSLKPTVTADQQLTFVTKLYDEDNNILNGSGLNYLLEDESGTITNITAEINENGGIWYASVVGEYEVSIWQHTESGYNISQLIEITVVHGDVFSLSHQAVATVTAGSSADVSITATDEDGNQWEYDAFWELEGSLASDITPTTTSGDFQYNAKKAGTYTLVYESEDGSVSGEWVISVSAIYTVKTIDLSFSSEAVDQQGKFLIQVRTFDDYGNEIPVPPSIKIEVTGEMIVTEVNSSSWEIIAVEAGSQMVIVKIGSIEESGEVEVTQTIPGFFAAGGTLYYAGAGLGVLIILVLLVVIVMVMRSGEDDEWDDEFEDEDEESRRGGLRLNRPNIDTLLNPASSEGPSSPPPKEEPPEEDKSWMADHRIDDDGTEWGQDTEGTWYYRDPGSPDWEEWTD